MIRGHQENFPCLLFSLPYRIFPFMRKKMTLVGKFNLTVPKNSRVPFSVRLNLVPPENEKLYPRVSWLDLYLSLDYSPLLPAYLLLEANNHQTQLHASPSKIRLRMFHCTKHDYRFRAHSPSSALKLVCD